MYEELMSLVQAGINIASTGRSSSELEEEGSSSEDGLKPHGKRIKSKPEKKQRAKW
jgi:hypothetical protein